MPRGRLEIKRVSPGANEDVTYEVMLLPRTGGLFVGSIFRQHLEEFLRVRLRLEPAAVDAALSQVREQDHASVDDVEITEMDLSAAGMNYLKEAG